MCTVSFLPLGNSKFMITSNRDDIPIRATSTIIDQEIEGKWVKFPQDPIAKGTWIAMSDDNQIAVLLNGATKKHIRQATYKESRGKMLLNFFKFDDVSAFVSDYDFEDIEPFTMIILDNGELYELIWDGLKMFYTLLDNQKAKIWASSTLYENEVKVQRKLDFDYWLANLSMEITKEQVVSFHQDTRSEDLENGFVINRGERVKTLSITNIILDNDSVQLFHKDLIEGSLTETSFEN